MIWPTGSRRRNPAQSAVARFFHRPVLESLEDRILPSTNVLTYHNDNARTGADLTETMLTPANVNVNDFGKLFTQSLDGNVYAQPLVMSNVPIPGKGLHDIVFVATEHDSVYAFDADTNGPALWQASFINPAAGVTPIPWQNAGNQLIFPEQGITATPVIDPGTNTLYVEAATKEVSGSTTRYVQRLHALDVSTGAEKFGGPVEIQASAPGTGGGGSQVTFDPLLNKERCALTLVNGIVYTAWSSQDDQPQIHGWIIGYNASTLQQAAVFCSTPNGSLATFWAVGEGLAADSRGNLYGGTGNGTFDTTAPRIDYGDTMLKLTPGSGGLAVQDFFTPSDQDNLDNLDLDFGSGGWALLPDEAGSPTHRHLLVTVDKSGNFYMIDRDAMGQYQPGGDLAVQEQPGLFGSGFSVPAYFNNAVYYAGEGNPLMALSVNNAFMSTTAISQGPTILPAGGSPSISANGKTNGIAWVVDTNGYFTDPQTGAVLYACDANNLSRELWDSNQAGTRDQLGTPIKFAVPTIANGHVYVGGLNTLTVFGLANFTDPGFESTILTTGGGAYQYGAADPAWTFTAGAGVAGNGSAFNNPVAPQGSHVAFLQGAGSIISQTVTVPTNGVYYLGFFAAQRPGNQQTFQVLVDGKIAGSYNTFTSASYTALATDSFALSAGAHTIAFDGTNLHGGDNTVFVDQVTIQSLRPGLTDFGFEQPLVGTGLAAYQYGPGGGSWAFSAGSGIAGNGSAFGNPLSPDGTQAAFLQGAGGSISQAVSFIAGGTYSVGFAAAQRPGNGQTFQVLVDGNIIASFNSFTSTSYTPLATGSFTVSAGIHTIIVRGTNLNGGDNTVFLDHVMISKLSPSFSDIGFEQPSIGTGPTAYQYQPAGGFWTYAGSAGVVGNGSNFSNPVAPQGTQAAFLQGSGGSIRQTVSFASGGNYAVSYLAAQRPGNQQTFQLFLDGNVIATFNSLTSTAYTQLATNIFSVSAGLHTIIFRGTNQKGGDNTVFLDQVVIQAASPSFADAGFEQLSQGTGAAAYRYQPAGGPWTYAGSAGLAGNGSAFNNPVAPQGTQVAILQAAASIRQTVQFIAAGTYSIGFLAAQRPGNRQTFQVLVDGNVIGTFNNFVSSGNAYTGLTTDSFSVSAGPHTVVFQGTNLFGGDNTVFLDQTTISAVPVTDGSFERPAIGTGVNAYQYGPAGGPWNFAPGAGLAGDGSAFGNPLSAQGTQAVFLQGGGGTVSQAVSFTSGGQFSLSFFAAQRLANRQTFQVLLDGQIIGEFDDITSTSYDIFTTNSFAVGAGVHTIAFKGTDLNSSVNNGDNTIFIDQVTIALLS
jgi:hypothetical protein